MAPYERLLARQDAFLGLLLARIARKLGLHLGRFEGSEVAELLGSESVSQNLVPPVLAIGKG